MLFLCLLQRHTPPPLILIALSSAVLSSHSVIRVHLLLSGRGFSQQCEGCRVRQSFLLFVCPTHQPMPARPNPFPPGLSLQLWGYRRTGGASTNFPPRIRCPLFNNNNNTPPFGLFVTALLVFGFTGHFCPMNSPCSNQTFYHLFIYLLLLDTRVLVSCGIPCSQKCFFLLHCDHCGTF